MILETLKDVQPRLIQLLQEDCLFQAEFLLEVSGSDYCYRCTMSIIGQPSIEILAKSHQEALINFLVEFSKDLKALDFVQEATEMRLTLTRPTL